MKITLGQKVRELRDEKDFSLREFAKKIDITAAHLSDIELGRRFPSRDVLKKIASMLKTPLAELEQYDPRPSVEDFKRLNSDPTYGFALRKLVDELGDQNISAEELQDFLDSRSGKNRNKK